MRQNSRAKPTVLVLGGKGVAERIARDLKEEGMDPVFQHKMESDLPSLPAEYGAFQKLKKVLERFIQESGQPARGLYVHPGVSIWGQRPELPMICQELGLTVIAPPARVISLFANRLNLLGEADRIGIATLVSSFTPIQSVREVENLLGGDAKDPAPKFPFILKSVRGESGYGLCIIRQPEDLQKKLPLWIEQLSRNYGEAILFPERFLEGARHIVVPFARFGDGHFEVFPMVDASLHSRHRKAIEFCPADSSSDTIDASAERKLRDWSKKLAEHTKFIGVGAFEYLVDGSRIFLLEGVARLTTSFHLWEKVAGTRAVSWQVATMGSSTPQILPVREPAKEYEQGILLRIFAEDPLLQLPQPGRLHEVSERRDWKLPSASAELDLTVEEGESIAPDTDGLVGLLHIFAQDRKRTLTLARGVLDEIWIAGALQTNERFLSELLFHPWVKEGIFYAGFVDEEFVPEIRPSPELTHLAASVCLGLTHPEAKGTRWSVGDLWVKKPDAADVKWVGENRRWEHGAGQGISGRVEFPPGRTQRVCAFPVAPRRWQVRIGAWTMIVRMAGSSGKLKLLSLIPGRVHSLLFKADANIPAHEPLLIVESLGTLVPHALSQDVRVKLWKVKAEHWVEAGQELAELEIIR